ncbi:unnamed protein product [Lactuca saligna]|uniref:Protein kinase domain-containing protein n=1 Tax=Lactuca saligna TaxID=75948 RepID=A0AA35VT75_LACSI|nr:unnamed protein product [Lactuca saligna]
MSSSAENLEKYRIPLKEIMRATRNFSSKTMIGDGGFGFVYTGQLSEKWKKRTVAIKRLNPGGHQGNNEFRNELDMVSSFHHPNIITFIGFCDEAKEMIIVSDFAINKSLDHHLHKPDKMRRITWAQRLKICLGAAKGLKYLHSGLGEDKRVIHRDVKSANILLDNNLDAKICDFGLSKFGARNEEDSQVQTKVAGTRYYMDPVYNERSRLTKESDVYSFGVVMFEMSSGTLVYHPKCFGSDSKPQFLLDVVRSCYDDVKNAARPETLIDPILRDDINIDSFNIFNKIAHECINLKLEQRPPMARIIRKIEHALQIQLNQHESPSTIPTRSLENFLIPLKDINLATQNFDVKTCIGVYEHCVVHKGELNGRTMAIQRLSPNTEHEFYKELKIISSFHHQNISTFIGYCDEANERIIVYEYYVNGSLVDHLENWSTKLPKLTWAQRLTICLGAARGLQYLHWIGGEDKNITRGNINNFNIMLDENMEAKITFFGLSKRHHIYHKLHEHIPDVYSFGVIMYEMLSGITAHELDRYAERENQIGLFQQYYRNNALNQFIDPFIRDQIDSRSLSILLKIAYRCIKRGNEKHLMRNYAGPGPGWGPASSGKDKRVRFMMDEVVEGIEDAADFEGNEK